MEEQAFTFLWELKYLNLWLKEAQEPIKSIPFFVPALYNTQWVASLYNREPKDQNSMTFCLKREHDDGPNSVTLTATLLLVAGDGTQGCEKTLTADIAESDEFRFQSFACRSAVEKFYHRKNTLTISCSLRKTDEDFTSTSLLLEPFESPCRINQLCTLKEFSQLVQGVLKKFTLYAGDKHLFNVVISVEATASGDIVVIEIHRTNMEKDICANTQITLIDASGAESEVCMKSQHNFSLESLENVWKFPTFINKDLIVKQEKTYLVNDVLVLKIEVSVSFGLKFKTTVSTHSTADALSSRTLAEEVKDLYGCQWLGDVNLRVLKETMPANRILLRSRSKKFAEMLDENGENKVLDVSDMDMTMLKRIVKYIYTNETDNLEFDDSVEMYISAWNYRIESLKCKYSFYLRTKLNVANVCRILMLAQDCRDYELKTCAMDFIKQHFGLVYLSEEWAKLSKGRRQSLAQEIKDNVTRESVVKYCPKYS